MGIKHLQRASPWAWLLGSMNISSYYYYYYLCNDCCQRTQQLRPAKWLPSPQGLSGAFQGAVCSPEGNGLYYSNSQHPPPSSPRQPIIMAVTLPPKLIEG